MAKYNKSEIMKEAWSIWASYKNISYSKVTFSDCLRSAWAEARTNVELQGMAGITFRNNMELTVQGYTRILNRWTKGDHDRVYIKDSKGRGDGYVDLKARKANMNNNLLFLDNMATVILAMNF